MPASPQRVARPGPRSWESWALRVSRATGTRDRSAGEGGRPRKGSRGGAGGGGSGGGWGCRGRYAGVVENELEGVGPLALDRGGRPLEGDGQGEPASLRAAGDGVL